MCPPQWLSVILASTAGPPDHGRRLLSTVLANKDSLRTAVQEYDANVTFATNTYGAIAGWDVSLITDMSSLFSSLLNFNADISSWDTSSVTSMNRMFASAAFNQPLSLNTSSVTDMHGMFDNALAFNQRLSLDTSSVTDTSFMFYNARAFNQPLSLDTSSVTDMSRMFHSASAFNEALSLDTYGEPSTGLMGAPHGNALRERVSSGRRPTGNPPQPRLSKESWQRSERIHRGLSSAGGYIVRV